MHSRQIWALGGLGLTIAVGGWMGYLRFARSANPPSPTPSFPYATIAGPVPDILPLKENTVAHVAELAIPAVARIVVQIPQHSTFRRIQGSGFFFNSQGYLLTNAHVIQHAQHIEVYLSGGLHPRPARIVAVNYQDDLAVLKIHVPEPMPVLPLASPDPVPVGSWTIAVGNMVSQGSTVTVGVVSATARPLVIGHYHFENLIQTSAQIGPGSSGGPLLNLLGQVIGMTTAVRPHSNGIGFAIPAGTIEKELARMMSKQSLAKSD